MSESPIVSVEQGQLQGKVVNTPSGKAYYAFQGIPYAKPPLGSLRFKAPQPCEPWEGVRDATSEGNISAQIELMNKSYVGDENCLFLNVATPNLDGAFLPVMVYIHGGALLCGSGNSDMFGPDYLVEKDVVVVTINYRLGALGFLCLNTPEVPGNAGLKDVVMALKWVKENVHNFGGNARNLTVFGESAGGGITSVLPASPMSKNLISRVIVQSGTALFPWWQQKKPLENARRLAETLGCESENLDDILEFLSTTPAKDIIEAQASFTGDSILNDDVITFTTVIEKEFPEVEAFITEPVVDLLTSGRVAQVPIMIGSNSLEFAFEKKSDDFQAFIPGQLNIEKDSETALEIVERMKKLYFKGEETPREYYQLISDKSINVDTHRYIQYLLQSSNIPIYVYKFDYVGELNISKKICIGVKLENEAMHLDELAYLFKNDFQKDVEPTPQDLKMRERMVRLWTNFAKTGNPTPDENHYTPVTWLPAAKDDERYLHLGQELSLCSNYDKEKMEFWDSLYQKYYKIWDQSESNICEVSRNDPIIVETLTIVSNEGNSSVTIVETVRQVVETSSKVVESSSEMVETSSEVVDTSGDEYTSVDDSSNLVDTSNEVTETAPVVKEVVETAPVVTKVEETAPVVTKVVETEVVDAPTLSPKAPKIIESFESNNVAKAQFNGNGIENKENKTVVAKRTSNEIKMVQNSNGAPKDVIRANDPPEDDLPKNIGVNKFVNFFESLGGKK